MTRSQSTTTWTQRTTPVFWMATRSPVWIWRAVWFTPVLRTLISTLALVMTPLAARVARAVGMIDAPGVRKIHQHPVPCLGGAAILASLMLGLGILVIFRGPLGPLEGPKGRAVAILAGALVVFAVGLVTTRHILPHLLSGTAEGRRTGLVLVWTIIPMVVSGYLVQVVSLPGWMLPLAIGHIVVGIVFLGGFLLHRTRKRARD